jgi:hypothetical protein
MFSTLSNWINNPLIQSLLLSPLMGVFFAAVFSGFDRSLGKNAPITVKETVREYRKIIYIEKEPKKAIKNDPLTIVIGIMMCIVFLTWKYVANSEAILSYLLIFVFTMISFSITTILISLVKGHFNSKDWWFYTVFPLLLLIFCVYLLSLAWTSIDPKIIEIARKNTAIDFYIQKLTSHGQLLVITQLIGVTLLFIIAIVSSLIELYYLALMNQRGQGFFRRLWILILQLTSKFSGRDTLIGSTLLSIGSFLLLKGYVTNWLAR